MKKLSLLFILLIAACTPSKSPLQSTRWSGQGLRPALLVDEIQIEAPVKVSSVQEEIQFSQQIVSGFRIQNAFIKTISEKGKGVVFESSALAYDISPNLLSAAESLNLNRGKSYIQFTKKNPQFNSLSLVGPIEVMFTGYERLKPALTAHLESARGSITLVTFDDRGRLLSSEIVGSHLGEFVESSSKAYTMGPKKSSLSPIVLNRRIQSEGLANSILEVTSNSPNKITDAMTSLHFDPVEDQFEEVQVFYYAQELLNWFKKYIELSGLFKLQITTFTGYPEKTNTAFYFRNQIRLGTGDDIIFSKMSWDPSIVMHETSHAIIDTIARLPTTGEGGSLNEGFADVFTTYYLNSPLLGDNSYQRSDYKRTVESKIKLSDKTGALYHDSGIVSGFFWDLKKEIGKEKATLLAFKVLNRLGPTSDFTDFVLALNEQTKKLLTAEELVKSNQLRKDREL